MNEALEQLLLHQKFRAIELAIENPRHRTDHELWHASVAIPPRDDLDGLPRGNGLEVKM